MTRFRCDRRRFLRGLGASVLLPALPSLTPRSAWAAAEEPKRRFVLFFAPNGADMPRWTPVNEGLGYTLSSALQPLAPVRDHVTVISGLQLPDIPSPSHQVRMRSLLTERLTLDPNDARYGRSLDQALAATVSADAPFRSLQLGTEPSLACGDERCGWLGTASWADETQPMPVLRDPISMFHQVFAGSAPGDAYAQAEKRKRSLSVLDTVLDDIDHVKATIAPGERRLLDQYLTGLRDVERRLMHDAPAVDGCPPDAPVEVPRTSPERVQLSLDLARAMLVCDVTRVMVFMLGSSESYRTLGFLGLPTDDHHGASHIDPDAHHAATTWQVDRFAAFVSALRDEDQPSGASILDDSFVLYTSEISTGPDHGGHDIPTMLAGGGGVGYSSQGHLRLPKSTPMASLSMSFLQSFGVPATGFGVDGTAPALALS